MSQESSRREAAVAARHCVECGFLYPLSEFVPRDNSQYDELHMMTKVFRQPRCRLCNKTYGRRRVFLKKTLAPLAEASHLEIHPKKGTSYRIIEIPSLGVSVEDWTRWTKLVEEFNRSLPDERSEIDVHGIRLEKVPARTKPAFEQMIIRLES